MSIITSLAAGVLIGWIVTIRADTSSREDLIRNIVVGIGGAFTGSWFLHKLFESANQSAFSLGTLIVSVLGAAVLLLLMNRLRRA